MLAAFLGAAPATANPPAGADLLRWISDNTDLSAAQIAIAGPEQVYSLHPLGPRTATGEVIAQVRTEPLDASWAAAHGFQSWEAHLLFDCGHGRMRQIRGASYSERNLKGRAVADTPYDGWIVPEPNQPAKQLFDAACEPAFAWPLRPALLAAAQAPAQPAAAPTAAPPAPARPTVTAVAQGGPPIPAPAAAAGSTPGPAAPAATLAAAPDRPTTIAAAQPGPSTPTAPAPGAAATPTSVAQAAQPSPAPAPSAPLPPRPAATPPAPGVNAPYSVQVARGPSEVGATQALARARKTLGPLGDSLTPRTETAQFGRRRRYTAILGGFTTAAAASEACGRLSTAGQECFTREDPAQAPAATAGAASAQPAKPGAEATAKPAPQAAPSSPFVVQIARGPSEAGAKQAVAKARKTLGLAGESLTATTETAQLGRRRRYTALLGGFASADAATEACDRLQKAGQTCFTRSGPAGGSGL